MALTLRTQKGSALTHQELDTNFTTLQQGLDDLPTLRNPDDVPAEKRGEVVEANQAALAEMDTTYWGCGFSYYPNGPDGPGKLRFACRIVAYNDDEDTPQQGLFWERTPLA